MRNKFLLAALCVLAIGALPARAADTAQQDTMKSCAATWKTMSAAAKAKTKYTDYMSSCMKAKPAAAAAGGQAKCKDGKPVTYKNRQGTCSGHGGVASWL